MTINELLKVIEGDLASSLGGGLEALVKTSE